MSVHPIAPSSPTTRLLPSDAAAEQAVLGGVFIKPSAFTEVSDMLATDDFFMPSHREIFEAMARTERRGNPIDLISVADDLRTIGLLGKLDGGEMYLLTLMGSTPTAENVGHYAKIVKAKAMARKFIALCTEATARAYALADPIDEIVAEHEVRVAALETKVDDVPVWVGDVIDDAMGVVEMRVANPDKFFVPTHLARFNKVIGGYGRERLIFVAAPPAGGKSAWGMNVAVGSAMGVSPARLDSGPPFKIPNLYISQEMGLQELLERAVGSVSNVETRRIHRGIIEYAEWRDIGRGVKQIRDIPLWIYDTPCGIEKICAVIRRWAAKVRRNLPLAEDGLPAMLHVTVDYIQLVKMEQRRGRSLAEALGEVSGSLKRLAKQLKFPITVLSQITRESRKARTIDDKPKEPSMEDLKGSGDLEQDADMIVFLWPEDAPEPVHGRPLVLESHADIIVAKNRGGATGKIPCRWDRRTMTFRDEMHDDGGEDSRLPRD